MGEGKLRGGQPSNSRLVLYFDVTRRPLCSVFSSAGRCVSFALYPAGRCAACALAPRCHAAVGGLWCVRPTLSLSLISGFISVTCYTLDNTYTFNLTSYLGLGQQRTLPSFVLSSVRFLPAVCTVTIFCTSAALSLCLLYRRDCYVSSSPSGCSIMSAASSRRRKSASKFGSPASRPCSSLS